MIGTLRPKWRRAVQARLERIGNREIDQNVAMILVDREDPDRPPTAAAIALPMRPPGANRLMRIGWSAVRIAVRLAKAAPAAPARLPAPSLAAPFSSMSENIEHRRASASRAPSSRNRRARRARNRSSTSSVHALEASVSEIGGLGLDARIAVRITEDDGDVARTAEREFFFVTEALVRKADDGVAKRDAIDRLREAAR